MTRRRECPASVLHHAPNSINQSPLPGRNNVGWIQRDGVKLVGLIDTELVAGALNIITLTVDAEIFDEQSILQAEVRIPDLKLAGIHDGRRFLVNEGNPAVGQ